MIIRDDTNDTLIGAKYFSELDLKSDYWQVEMNKEDKHKTAFTVGNLGFFTCNRMERCIGRLNLKEFYFFLTIFSCFLLHLRNIYKG